MKMIENVPIKQMISKIHLSGMEFYAHHGCFEEERHVGAHFKVDVILEYDAAMATTTDAIAQAVNYQSVYSDIKEIMRESVNLLETLCQKVLSVLKEKYPQIIHAEVTIYKINPTLGGKIAAVSVSGEI